MVDSCVSYLTNKVNSSHFDGICIDFDKLPAKNNHAFLSFSKQLDRSLYETHKTLRITLPAVDFSNSFNILQLNEMVDQYILLAFNYYHKGSSEGPVAPLNNTENFDVKTSVNKYLEKGIRSQKLIVALPTYGIVWQKSLDGSTSVFEQHIYLGQILEELSETEPKPTVILDSTTFTKYFDHKKDGKEFRTYYDDAETLEKKLAG